MDAFDKDVGKLQKLQNRAMRIHLNANNCQHVDNLHHDMAISKLCDRRTYHLSIYAYKRSRNDEYLDKKPIVTRQRDAPLMKSFKSDYKVVDRCVYLQTANLWNKMDIDTRNIDNLDSYKLTQKKWLLEQIPQLID